LVSRRGLRGHKYPRDFLRAVKKEGVGRITHPVDGHPYICYNGGASFRFADSPTGRDAEKLVPCRSAAARPGMPGFHSVREFILTNPMLKKIFHSARWEIKDTGGGLRRWQVDLYWGEEEPLGPGRFMARPRGTTFEYCYSEAHLLR
jgi:hypothetical protein